MNDREKSNQIFVKQKSDCFNNLFLRRKKKKKKKSTIIAQLLYLKFPLSVPLLLFLFTKSTSTRETKHNHTTSGWWLFEKR